MELLTAQQAAELAKIKEPEINAKREASVQETLQAVMKQIKSAADKGDRFIRYDFTSVEHKYIVFDRLRKLGYIVGNTIKTWWSGAEKKNLLAQNSLYNPTYEPIIKEITW